MHIVDLTSAALHRKGFFLTVEGTGEDFWVFLSDVVGWGRYSRVSNRMLALCDNLYELVEIRPPHLSMPYPVVCALHDLWRRADASNSEHILRAMRENELLAHPITGPRFLMEGQSQSSVFPATAPPFPGYTGPAHGQAEE